MSKPRRELPAPRFALDVLLGSAGALWGNLRATYGRERLLTMLLVVLLLASPWSITNVLLLAALAIVMARDPGFTTAALPFAAPFAYQPKAFFGPRFPVVELLLAGALVGTALVALRFAWHRWRDGSASATLLDTWDVSRRVITRAPGLQATLLALLAILSLATIADPTHLRESIRELRTVILEPVVYLFLALYWLRRAELRAFATGAFLAGASAVALIAIGQFVTGFNVVLADGSRRVTSVYQHPNNLALYLGRAFIFGVGLLACGAYPLQRRKLMAALVALVGGGLLLSVSLGAFLGVGVALVVIALAARNTSTRLALLGAVGLAGLAVLLFARGRLGALLGGGGSFGLRRLIWGSALAMLRDHPAFGVGLDQFLYQYAPRYVQPPAWAERFTAHPHNLVLDFWLRLGIMGLAWLGWTLATVISRLFGDLRAATAERRAMLVAISAALIAALIHGLVDNFFFLIDLAYIWWFFIALAYVTPIATGPGQRIVSSNKPVTKERR